jgi:hypothetical protein
MFDSIILELDNAEALKRCWPREQCASALACIAWTVRRDAEVAFVHPTTFNTGAHTHTRIPGV